MSSMEAQLSWFGNDFHPSCHCSRVIGRRNEGRIRRLQRNMRFLAASRTSTACKSQPKYHRKISNCFNCVATIEINAELEQIYSNYQKPKSICVAELRATYTLNLMPELFCQDALVPGMISIKEDGHLAVRCFPHGNSPDRFDLIIVRDRIDRAFSVSNKSMRTVTCFGNSAPPQRRGRKGLTGVSARSGASSGRMGPCAERL